MGLIYSTNGAVVVLACAEFNALPITDTQACVSDSAMRHHGSRVRVWGSVLSGFVFGIIHYLLCFTLTSIFLVIKLVAFDLVFPDLYPCNCKVDRWAGRTETSPIWRIEGGRLEHRLSSSCDEVRTPPPRDGGERADCWERHLRPSGDGVRAPLPGKENR